MGTVVEFHVENITYLSMKIKNIKWKKGLTRLWLVFSIPWLIYTILYVINGDYSYGTTKLGLFAMVFFPPLGLAFLFFVLPKLIKWLIDGFR